MAIFASAKHGGQNDCSLRLLEPYRVCVAAIDGVKLSRLLAMPVDEIGDVLRRFNAEGYVRVTCAAVAYVLCYFMHYVLETKRQDENYTDNLMMLETLRAYLLVLFDVSPVD